MRLPAVFGLLWLGVSTTCALNPVLTLGPSALMFQSIDKCRCVASNRLSSSKLEIAQPGLALGPGNAPRLMGITYACLPVYDGLEPPSPGTNGFSNPLGVSAGSMAASARCCVAA